MMIYKNELTRIMTMLEERQHDLENELKRLPEGMLYVQTPGDKDYYYERFPVGGNRKKEHRIGISRDEDRIFALVRKRYVVDAIKILKEDISRLKLLIGKYKMCDEQSVMKEFLERYPDLAGGVFRQQQAAEEWMRQGGGSEGFFKDDLKSRSLKGEKMRSAAEIYISSRLEHHGIPYRYEAPLSIPDLGYYPDFTILRPRDRRIIYWEHFGMVTDRDYVMDNIEKLIRYMDYGITPWDNLIMTYNNIEGGFDAKLIDSMIEGWLL